MEQNQIVSETILKFSEEVRKLNAGKTDDYVNCKDLLALLPLSFGNRNLSFFLDDIDFGRHSLQQYSCEMFLKKFITNEFGFDEIHAGTLKNW